MPGSAHDRLVRWSKIALPSAVGVLIAVLALAPLDKKGDVSFILDKKKVENAPERMRVEAARYIGTDNKGQQFVIAANRAIQRSSDVPIVDISGMFARLGAGARAAADRAPTRAATISTRSRSRSTGRCKVAGPDGYRLATRDVTVDLKQRKLASAGPVVGRRCGSASSRPGSSRPILATEPWSSMAALA